MPGVSTKTIWPPCADPPLVEVLHREDPIAGRLGLVGNDGHLGPDDPVEEGGFARVGAADERDRAGMRH